ncbi:MAG TPA: M48 family metallopeptidase [bacterium]
MRKRNSGWGKGRGGLAAVLACAGCATTQYAVRPTPVPVETPQARQIEESISAYQAEEFAKQGARAIRPGESIRGLAVQRVVERLAKVTERSSLPYQAYVYEEDDPNAAALADGRIYVSRGMLDYLTDRGPREDELAFVIAHELAHTTAQHLVQRYERLRQQQFVMTLVAAGAALATQNAASGAQQAGRLAVDLASLVNEVAISGYSQQQELEADQLGMRYLMRAGYDPHAALALLEDFTRFDSPMPFLRTHPYVQVRIEHLRRYLSEASPAAGPSAASFLPAESRAAPGSSDAEAIRRLREVQQLYPAGSVSWNNLQRQIDALQRR